MPVPLKTADKNVRAPFFLSPARHFNIHNSTFKNRRAYPVLVVRVVRGKKSKPIRFVVRILLHSLYTTESAFPTEEEDSKERSKELTV